MLAADTGTGLGLGLPLIGEFWLDGKPVGSGQWLRTIPVPVEMVKEPFVKWRRRGDCYRVIKKNKNYFYNMEYENVLDKKLPAAGENEIT